MWATYIGIFKPGARENPDTYYDRPFDMFEAYYDINVYRLPASWSEVLGKSKQMDWGSWLQTCDRQTFRKLFSDNDTVIPIIPFYADAEHVGRQPPVPAKEIPDGERYGFLEVELE